MMYEMHDLNAGTEYQFDTVDELLRFARQYVVGYMGRPNILFTAPGYSMGGIAPNNEFSREGEEFRMKWRTRTQRERPVKRCMECGADEDEIRGWRCTRCGCDDMVVESWFEYDYHEEILSRW